MAIHRRTTTITLLGSALLIATVWPVAALADGWHNASLQTGTLDQWLDQQLGSMRSAMPRGLPGKGAGQLQAGNDIEALKNRVKQSTPANGAAPKAPLQGGRIVGKLTPQQQAMLGRAAGECLQVLACMDRRNIFPHEFPNFPMQQIPKYRDAAKQMLRMMGPQGGSAVATQLRSELMGMSMAGTQGVPPHPDYYRELLALLEEHANNGDVTEQELADLQQATGGNKAGPLGGLAKATQDTLAKLKNADVSVLLRWAEQTTDSKRRTQLFGRIRGKLTEATLAELLAVNEAKPDSLTRSAVARELEKRWATANPLELLEALQSLTDPALRGAAIEALSQKSPRYADVKQDLAKIWQLASSRDAQVAAGAREQAVNAFLRAPIPECLDWFAKADDGLEQLIWQQIDDRISRADGPRRAGYRDAALETLGDNGAAAASRIAAIDLLGKLGDRQAAGPVIELLLPLPQELRPRAGKLLKDLTGQNFGPRVGDGTDDVTVAVKKWRAWWKANSGQ
jgi:hypothetical protein